MEISDWRLEIGDWRLETEQSLIAAGTSTDGPLANFQSPLIRPAGPDDVAAILALVNDHARRGDLLPRTAASIRQTLPDWLVGESEAGRIIACVSLLFYTPTLAEVRSLAVDDTCKGQGWGSAILETLIAEARQRGVPTLFALTRAVRFFERAGFTITSKDRFPEKVWRDCHICPIRHRCDETAVVRQLIMNNK